MKRPALFLALLAVAVTSIAVPQAQATNPTPIHLVAPNLTPIQPYRGMYYERGRGGTGLFIDKSPKGSLFMVYFTFDAQGNQKYYLMQGDFEPASEAYRSLNGVLGTAAPTTYVDAGGECVEGECPYKDPSRALANVQAHLTWYTPRMVDLELGDKTFHLRAMEVDSPDGGDLNDSTWIVSWGVSDIVPPLEHDTMGNALAIMQLVPAPFARNALQIVEGSPSGIQLPPENAELYLLQCYGEPAQCYDLNYRMFALKYADPTSTESGFGLKFKHHAMFWYDSSTHTAGLDTIEYRGSADVPYLGRAGYHFDMYFDGPGLAIGHGIDLEAGGLNQSIKNGNMVHNLIMKRVSKSYYRAGKDAVQ
jgi:hypothetical protein